MHTLNLGAVTGWLSSGGLLKAKLRATGIHLCISFFIFLILAWLILFVWYPGPHFRISGGWQGMRILAGVDIVLGPFLMFLIFNPAKSRLAVGIDLSFIALAQASALCWGIYAVHSQRPVVLPYWDGTFYATTAEPFKSQGIDFSEIRDLSQEHPPVVYTKTPESAEEKAAAVTFALTEGVQEHELFVLYRSLSDNMGALQEIQEKVHSRLKGRPEFRERLQAIAEQQGGRLKDFILVPLIARYGEAMMVISRHGRLLDAVID